jgi:hypothetical protein
MRKTVGLFVIFLFGGVWLESAQATIARIGGGMQPHVQNRSADVNREILRLTTSTRARSTEARAASAAAPSVGAPSTRAPSTGAPSTGAMYVDAGAVDGTNAIVLPQFAMGGGWATQIVLVKTGTALARSAWRARFQGNIALCLNAG